MGCVYKNNGYEVVLPNFFKKDPIIDISGVYTMFKVHRPECCSPPECHTAIELVYVIDGEINFTADKTVYSMPEGHITFHPSMEYHQLRVEKNKKALIFVCTFDARGKAVNSLKSGVFKLGKNKKMLDEIIEYLDREKPFLPPPRKSDYISMYEHKPEALHIAIKMLEVFISEFINTQPQSKSRITGTNITTYSQIVSFMEENIHSWITTEDIAEFLGKSVSTIKNITKQYSGYPVHKLFVNMKMRKAVELLRKGKYAYEISDILGFCDPNYFSRAFFREMGQHIGDYKAGNVLL